MKPSRNEILNLPFEFEEVLISPQAARSLGRAAALAGTFGETVVPSAPQNVSTRELSVRLRTINNACEGPFRMADERPITEVSLYGSRERQFLIGPYWGVKLLMEGALPWKDRSEFASVMEEVCGVLKSTLDIVDVFLDDPNTGSTTARVEDAERIERAYYEGNRFASPIEGNTAKNVKMEQKIDLTVEKIERIREFSLAHHEVLDELNALRAEVETAPWWWGWTQAFEDKKARVMQLGSEYLKQKEMLRPPEWPRHRVNTHREPDYAGAFFE